MEPGEDVEDLEPLPTLEAPETREGFGEAESPFEAAEAEEDVEDLEPLPTLEAPEPQEAIQETELPLEASEPEEAIEDREPLPELDAAEPQDFAEDEPPFELPAIASEEPGTPGVEPTMEAQEPEGETPFEMPDIVTEERTFGDGIPTFGDGETTFGLDSPAFDAPVETEGDDPTFGDPIRTIDFSGFSSEEDATTETTTPGEEEAGGAFSLPEVPTEPMEDVGDLVGETTEAVEEAGESLVDEVPDSFIEPPTTIEPIPAPPTAEEMEPAFEPPTPEEPEETYKAPPVPHDDTLAADPSVEEAPPVVEGLSEEPPTVGLPPLPSPHFGRREPKEKAERLARVLVSDIILYNPDRHQRALDQGSLKEEFEEEIQKSWNEYVDQVGDEIANSTNFFNEALNEILAKGQPIF